MEIPLLYDLMVCFGLSVIALMICHRLKMPALLGFLLTGMIAGPHGLGLIQAEQEVEILAEIGVVLLLFSIGIEFSLTTLLRSKKSVFLGGGLQFFLTFAAGFGLALGWGQPTGSAVFIGFLFVLSSTAIVLKQLKDRAEIDTPHGRIALAILIFQDLLVAPLMLLTPMLAGQEGGALAILFLLLKATGLMVFVLWASRKLVPWLLIKVAGTRSRETFLITIVGLGLAVAFVTHEIGLSYALGAFLAGLVISESDYGHYALGAIVPFRDVFTSLFFISIGMLFNVTFLWDHLWVVLSLSLLLVMIKAILGAIAAAPLGFPGRTWLLTGLALSQIGEFSFVLSRAGMQYDLLSPELYQYFLDISIVTMAVTPGLMALGPRLVGWWVRWRSRHEGDKRIAHPCMLGAFNDHVVIIGFGLNGQNVARAARLAGISYAIVEMNSDTVRAKRAEGEPIFFGDASQEEILHQVGVQCARAVVVGISDPVATRQTLVAVRAMNPAVHLLVRTKYMVEVDELYELGADDVVPEELESSVELFTRILQRYLVPKADIARFTREIRADGYAMFRNSGGRLVTSGHLVEQLPGVEVVSCRVEEGCEVVGRSLADLDLRRLYEITVLAVQKDSHFVVSPNPHAVLEVGNLVLVMGAPEAVTTVSDLFSGSS